MKVENSCQDRELAITLLKDFDKGFRELVEHHQPALYGVAFGVLNNHTLTHDAVQESLCKAYSSLKVWCSEEPKKVQTLHFRAWLSRVTYTTSLDLYYLETDFWRVEPLEKVELMESQGQRFEQPGTYVIDIERQQKIQEAWEKLPYQQSQVLQLRFFQDGEVAIGGNKYKGIAQILGIPENTVKSHMRRGVKRLRKLLSQYKRKAS